MAAGEGTARPFRPYDRRLRRDERCSKTSFSHACFPALGHPGYNVSRRTRAVRVHGVLQRRSRFRGFRVASCSVYGNSLRWGSGCWPTGTVPGTGGRAKDHPLDKADSVDILVIWMPVSKSAQTAASCRSLGHGNGTHTYAWLERYLIARYLVSIALTNYMEFSDCVHDSLFDFMQVLNGRAAGTVFHRPRQRRQDRH